MSAASGSADRDGRAAASALGASPRGIEVDIADLASFADFLVETEQGQDAVGMLVSQPASEDERIDQG